MCIRQGVGSGYSEMATTLLTLGGGDPEGETGLEGNVMEIPDKPAASS